MKFRGNFLQMQNVAAQPFKFRRKNHRIARQKNGAKQPMRRCKQEEAFHFNFQRRTRQKTAGVFKCDGRSSQDRRHPSVLLRSGARFPPNRKNTPNLHPSLRYSAGNFQVREEMEIFTAKKEQNRAQNCEERRTLHLRIASNLPKVLYVGEKLVAIRVALIDSLTGEPTSCPQSSLTLNVVVLQGDFHKDDNEKWTESEFDSAVVRGRDQKSPLVIGNLKVTMKDGVGEAGGFSFTDNSSWVRSKKFRLGIKAESGGGVQIREAVSDAFSVLAQRGEAYMKHHPPQPQDEVWRLMKIRKDGYFHNRLTSAGIHTVEQFVNRTAADEEGMRRILGSNMRGRNWKTLYEHAKTCVFPQSENWVFDLRQQCRGGIQQPWCFPHMNRSGEELGNGEVPQSADMHHLISSASQALQEEDLRDSNSFVKDIDCFYVDGDGGEGSSNNDELPPLEYASSYPCFQGGIQRPLYFPHINRSGDEFAQYVGHEVTSQSMDMHHLLSSVEVRRPLQEEDLSGNSFLTKEDMEYFHPDWEVGDGSLNDDELPPFESGSSYPYFRGYVPPCASKRAVIGWLKLKAALQWGIFVRKKAVKRQVRLIELHD